MKTYLGLDVGTENIGYALAKSVDEVVSEDGTIEEEGYEIVSANGKSAMGVLAFEQAETAVARRTYRAARRRLERRRYRIDLLQEIFNDAIMKKDKNFLRRLDENDLYEEDRSVGGKYSLFNDEDFDDVRYYQKYPTIYHLRNALMTEGTDDVRLLYLGIHHIIKYRGNFLMEGSTGTNEVGSTSQLKILIDNLNIKLDENREAYEDFNFDKFCTDNLDEIKDLVCGVGDVTKSILDNITTGKKFVSKKDKKTKMYSLLGVDKPMSKNSISKNIVDILMGGKVNISNLFGEECYAKEEVQTFTMADEWENIQDLQLLKGDMVHADIIDTLKAIYDWIKLNELLKGKKSLSVAMIDLYNTHKSDLMELKDFVKRYASDKYEEVFGVKRDKKNNIDLKFNNYTKYIGGGRFDGEKVGANGRIGKTCTQEDFYKYIKKIIEEVKIEEAQELKQSLLGKIENGIFLPKIVSKNNSTLPYQLNMMELEKILSKAEENPQFAFLREVSDGKQNAEKIKLLLKFRIPYYVGPVKEYKKYDEKKYAWAVRKQSGRVTPWNIDEKIDMSNSNVNFIERMTNNCTYLRKAKTLPKYSILFSKYCCLNEINTLKINGDAISAELKKELFNEIFLKYKNVTSKKIKKYLIDKKGYDKSIVLSGIDNEIKSSMKTYLMYKDVLGDLVDSDNDMVERIIFLSTIHNDSNMLEKSIREEFEGKLTEEQIKRLKGFKFNGWASLSAEFLAGYKHNGIKLVFDGEMLDIIDIMYEYNYNLQQILYHEKCNYQQALQLYNREHNIEEETKVISYENDIAEYPCSPTVKKCVWQSFKLVKDIVKQSQIVPDVVFIESCRENTDKKKGQRTSKRRDMILSVYEEAKKKINECIKEKEDVSGYKDLLESVESCKKHINDYSDSQLKKENLYLYFMQLGKDIYSGLPLDLDKVLIDNVYDHDHIIPQARIKDDSFTNLVLTAREINEKKSDIYPVPPQYRQLDLWKKLHKIGLLSDEKYARLARKTEISAEEQDKFINRQLVETSQTVVLLRDLLKRYFVDACKKEVEIVLSKAGNVTMFRKEFEITKSREVNDFHHAWDAYLNIVVGDILTRAFNRSKFRRQDNGQDKSYNFLKVLKNKMYANNCKMLNSIKNMMNSTDFQMVKLPEEKTGAFYSEVLKTADKDENTKLIPMCDSKIVDGKQMNPKCDVAKYGGYLTANTAFFVVADSDGKKGETIRSIVAVSIFDYARIKNKKMTYEDVFKNMGLKNGRLASIDGMKEPIIKTGSLLDFGAYRLRLAGATGHQLILHNANQLLVDSRTNSYVKELSALVDKVVKAAKKEECEKESLTEEIITERIRRKNLPANKNANIVIVNKEDNLKIYNFFIQKLSHHPYKDIPSYGSLLKILIDATNSFVEKGIYEQAVLLLNIIKAFQCNAMLVDISALSYVDENEKVKTGGTSQCAIRMNCNITDNDNLTLINQSMSGLKEQRIKLGLKRDRG